MVDERNWRYGSQKEGMRKKRWEISLSQKGNISSFRYWRNRRVRDSLLPSLELPLIRVDNDGRIVSSLKVGGMKGR